MPKTHGMTKTPEYQAWRLMRYRCNSPRMANYRWYGERGIAVCDLWQSSFESFYADMGPRPGPEYSLDRIDNDGNYEPGNCRWATRSEQSSNRRTTRLIAFKGVTMTVKAWSTQIGISRELLKYRLDHGWTLDAALTGTDLTLDAEWCDVAEAAHLADKHPDSVKRLIRLGHIPASRWGQGHRWKWIIRRADVSVGSLPCGVGKEG